MKTTTTSPIIIITECERGGGKVKKKLRPLTFNGIMNTDILWIRSSVFFSKCNRLMIFIQTVWSVDSPLHFSSESCTLHFRSIDAFDILNSEHWLSECGRRAKLKQNTKELNTVDFAIRNRNSMSTRKKRTVWFFFTILFFFFRL